MHWTQTSIADFIYNISATFVSQLESRMEEKEINKSELAIRLQKSNGRVSQVLNDPGNLSLRVIVEYARALGMKVGIVAYDDGDPDNNNGPINPDVFVKSWEKLNRPGDLFEVAEAHTEQQKISWDCCAIPNIGVHHPNIAIDPIWGRVVFPASMESGQQYVVAQPLVAARGNPLQQSMEIERKRA